MARPVCEAPGLISSDPVSGAVLCLDDMGAPVAWLLTVDDEPFDLATLDTELAAQAFTAAFVIVGTCWAIGKGVGLLLSVVRR